MPLTWLKTPSARFRLVLAPGLLTVAVILAWAMQPPQGATLNLTAWRPFSIHPAVWVCLCVGFGAYLISTWIWALKADNAATRLFAASGVMTLLFTLASTRSFMALPAPDAVLSALQTTNTLAASGFGIVMLCLFLTYPNRLPHWRWGVTATLVVFGAWTLLRSFGPWRHPASVQPITLAEMIGILLLGACQIGFARHDPRQRAIALWIGASVFLGAGTFIGLVSLPVSLGRHVLVQPQYAFAAFLVIYAGLAIGLVRYRLFELGGWAFQLIFHAGIALILLAVDAVLIGFLSLAPGATFGLSLLAMAFLYLPLRDTAWRRLTKSRVSDQAEIFHAVIETALKPSGPERAAAWEQLLRHLYHPLELTPSPQAVTTPAIAAEGLALHLPPAANAPALSLHYPRDGRALFTPRDLAIAEQIIALMHHAEESRAAYDRGVSAERLRIARDMHDNIGAQLLRALHSAAPERKDAMIRDTLADLRDVISNAQSADLPLALSLADLRAETADRLSPHGVTLAWRVDAPVERPLRPAGLHALRSLVREATSNTIKHAAAGTMTVTITVDATGVALRVEDDGRGFARDSVSLGHGLDNMKSRAESLGGTFSLSSQVATSGTGTCLAAFIPYDEAPTA